MTFAQLIGNERNKTILQRLLLANRHAATLIFAGPEGIGKRQFALALAKAANCQQPRKDAEAYDSCGTCPVCRRIDAGTYGDVMTIQPEGQFVKVGQTRALAEDIYTLPREGRHRFFLIDEADRLNQASGNAFLKTLEEPPPYATIILLTHRPDLLLPTIRSRGQRISFTPLTTAEMEDYLKANFTRPLPDNVLLARLTEGRIGQATAFDLSVYRQERNVLLGLLDILAAGENRYRLLKAAEYLGKKERDEFERELDLLSRLLRDVFLLASGQPVTALVNADVADKLNAIAQRIGLARVMAWIEKFNELRASLRFNVNRQVATEAALLSLIEAA